MPVVTPLCRHCRDRKAHRPRGLCVRCYYMPGVRDKYPLTSKFARRGLGVGFTCKRPEAPTTTLPGGLAKKWVMRERARRGESVFHPGDVTLRRTEP